MTTQQDTTAIARLLRDKRGTGYKSEAARKIGVSRQVYDAWESGHFIPGDEWAEPLAVYLERDLAEIVLRLFNDRAKKRDPDTTQLDITWSCGGGADRLAWEWSVRPIDAHAAA